MTSAFRIPVHDADAGGSEVPLPEFSRDWALFLDVDGTLVELAEHPRAVHVEPPLIQQLGRLQRLAGDAGPER